MVLATFNQQTNDATAPFLAIHVDVLEFILLPQVLTGLMKKLFNGRCWHVESSNPIQILYARSFGTSSI